MKKKKKNIVLQFECFTKTINLNLNTSKTKKPPQNKKGKGNPKNDFKWA